MASFVSITMICCVVIGMVSYFVFNKIYWQIRVVSAYIRKNGSSSDM